MAGKRRSKALKLTHHKRPEDELSARLEDIEMNSGEEASSNESDSLSSRADTDKDSIRVELGLDEEEDEMAEDPTDPRGANIHIVMVRKVEDRLNGNPTPAIEGVFSTIKDAQQRARNYCGKWLEQNYPGKRHRDETYRIHTFGWECGPFEIEIKSAVVKGASSEPREY